MKNMTLSSLLAFFSLNPWGNCDHLYPKELDHGTNHNHSSSEHHDRSVSGKSHKHRHKTPDEMKHEEFVLVKRQETLAMRYRLSLITAATTAVTALIAAFAYWKKS